MLATLAEAGAATGEPRLASRPRSGAASSCSASLRRADGRWLRSWQAGDGDRPAARHLAYAADHAALVDAFTRLAEATGEARWIAEARAAADALLELFWDDDEGGAVHHRRRRRGPGRPPEGPARQRHAVGQQPGRRRPRCGWPPSPARTATASAPTQILRLFGPLAGRAPHRLRPPARRRRPPPRRHHRGRRRRRPPRPGRPPCTQPLPAQRRAGLGRAATTRRCGRAADDGQAYVCRDYACQLPVDTARGARWLNSSRRAAGPPPERPRWSGTGSTSAGHTSPALGTIRWSWPDQGRTVAADVGGACMWSGVAGAGDLGGGPAR